MENKFKIVVPYLKERKWIYFLGFIFLAIVDGLQLLIPKIIQYVIDGITNHKTNLKTILYSSLTIIAKVSFILFLISDGDEL